MSNRKKLIIYTDGSYADGKSGWAFYISCNKNDTSWILGYGSYASKGSVQSEINACIEALNYLPEITDQRLNDIEVIEIRSDYLELVKFIINYQKPKFERRLNDGNYSCYTKEFLSLLEVIKKLPVELHAKKVNNKDRELLKVHKMAKYSLLELPNDNDHFYLEISYNEERTFLKKKSIIGSNFNELEEVEQQKWFDYLAAEIINLPVSNIFIEEDIHLVSSNIRFGGNLKSFKESNSIDKPIAVRKNGENYVLVAGMSRLCAAKLLGFKTIPAVILDISHVEFLLKYVI